ncbi:MAG: hypothetical protein ACTHN3_10770 [Solirubrobacterales bacterium]
MAQANTKDILEGQSDPPTAANGWLAGTCTTPTCTPETPGEFFNVAGGHPPFGYTQYTIKQKTVEVAPGEFRQIPVGPLGTIKVDLPPGLTVNPNATPVKCTLAQFNEAKPGDPSEGPNCPAESQTGVEQVTLKVVAGPGTGVPVAPIPGVTEIPVYNLVPEEGEPALFGFKAGQPGSKEEVFLKTEVSWQSDFHESFSIKIPAPSPGTLPWKSRLVQNGRAGNGTFITNPTTCFNPAEWPHLYSTWARAISAEEEAAPNTFPVGFEAFEAKVEDSSGNLIQQEGCNTVPFEPSVVIDAGSEQVDSPSAATVDVRLPFDPAKEGNDKQSQSHVRKAEVTLPRTMGINPSGAQGLVACTDQQFKKGVRVYDNECPAASKIGTASVESPPLERPLTGDVYVGTQNSRDPQSGEEFRILIEAKEQKEGVALRLIGHVKPDLNTGQLTVVVDEQEKLEMTGSEKDIPSGLPQAPFTSVKVHLDGSKAILTSPAICSTSSTSHLEPWARPGENRPTGEAPSKDTTTVTVSKDPTGGDCPKTMAERKFTPAYKANPDSTQAGSYTPFHVHIARKDGEQELKVVNVTLPKGLTGKLAGIPYCPEDAIAAAANKSGTAEIANPSCPDNSFLGTAETVSGTGSNPLKLAGNVYLAGPYKGAPVSLVVTTPAVAGPFDLGTVVVRVALNVNPETAQVNAVSDVIPDVFGGVKLDLRSIDLNINRKKFMLNPTNCAAQATTGAINGGGADPTNPATFSSYAVNDPFQATGCKKLGFQPKLKLNLYGPTKRAKNPRLKAILTAKKGQANIARTAVTMPHSLFLDQSHIGTVCTRPQLASHTCPSASVYGKAWAKSPLLKGKLAGKVYLVSSSHELPDLLVDLRGQVEVYLRGVISSKRGGLKTVFNNVPDVPVSKFVLNMKGGKKSLLVNSTNTCAKAQRAVVKIKGQNGKKHNDNRQKLNIISCGKHKKHHK